MQAQNGGTITRLIPTHAGKTAGGQRRSGLATAHPHSRGENALPALKNFAAQGSSPLTRGKPLMPSQTLEKMGLIPTHAGKTLASGM